MDDRMLLDNYLLILKSTVEVYVHGTLESSNSKVRNLLKKSLDNIITMQGDTYNEMQDNGWYQTKNVDTKTISKTLNKIQNS